MPAFDAEWVLGDSRGSIRATSDHPLFRGFMWSWNGGDGVRIWFEGRAFSWLDLSSESLNEIRPNFMDEGEFQIFLELLYEDVKKVQDIRKIRHAQPEYDEEKMREDQEQSRETEPDYGEDLSSYMIQDITILVDEGDEDELFERLEDYWDEKDDPEYEEDWLDDDMYDEEVEDHDW